MDRHPRLGAGFLWLWDRNLRDFARAGRFLGWQDGTMKRSLTAAAVTLLVVSCGLTQREVEFTLEADKVQFPAVVGTAEALPIAVSVTVGGCRGFKRFEAQRTASALVLRVVGQERVGRGVVCPANIAYQTHTYTDPNTPPRADPFEVIVNGKSWGQVNVK